MQVRPGRQLSRIPDQSDRLTGYHMVSHLFQQQFVVLINRDESVLMLYLNYVSVVRIETGIDHRTIQRSQDTLLRGRGQIHAIMMDIRLIMRGDHAIHGLIEKDPLGRYLARVGQYR